MAGTAGQGEGRWERRPEERPAELMEAALRVFAERGYRSARLDDVAAAAGVTKGTLYHYFANKEELLRRALEHYQDRAFGRVTQVLHAAPASAPAADRIRAVLEELFAGTDPMRAEVVLVLQAAAQEVPDVYRDWLRRGPVKGWRLLARLIEAGQEAGELRADVDGEVAARVCVTGLMVQLTWQRQSPELPAMRISRERLVTGAVGLLLAALRRN